MEYVKLITEKVVLDKQSERYSEFGKMTVLPFLGAKVMSCLPSVPLLPAPYLCCEPEEALAHLEPVRHQLRSSSSLCLHPCGILAEMNLQTNSLSSWLQQRLKGPSLQLLSIRSISSIFV